MKILKRFSKMREGKSKRSSAVLDSAREKNTIGSNMSFAAKEAYKLLRTNLSYILSDEGEGCRMIGVTSSLRGEGKSTTSINLAYVLAEMHKKVLLVDGDLRIPSLHKKLNKAPRPGLSNALAGQTLFESCCQKIASTGDNGTSWEFDLLVAGNIPPNPSELIGSLRMHTLMDQLREKYDYIILDLPPVTAVTDALIAADMVDGLIVVVRSNHAERGSLSETLRQIKLVNGKVLGFVMTCAEQGSGGYGKKYRYRYRYRYYSKDYKQG